MDPLPMVPSCALDQSGLLRQLERYRRAGSGAVLVERTHRRFVVDLDEHVDRQAVEEAIAVERGCCPFFTIEWEAERRRLTVSVSQPEHEPALDAILYALDLRAPASRPLPD